MKTIIRNFISTLRRFKTATLLNILGLSIAFTAVIVIMMQVTYDLEFNSNQPEADHIYRIEADFEGRRFALLPRPFVEEFVQFSPHVEAGSISSAFMAQMYNWFLEVEQQGQKYYYSERMMEVSADFVNVFRFDMIEGRAKEINNPDVVLIPESMARKMFGNESAVQKQLKEENSTWTVGGVYKDFPTNTSTANCIYKKIPDDRDKTLWGSFNYDTYVRITPSADMESILQEYVKTIDPKKIEDMGLENVSFTSTPLRQIHFETHTEFDAVEKTSIQTVWVLIAIAFVILLIAVINFTNYSIALTPLRIKSINTQKVLGASEKRLRASLLVEAVAICLFSWLLSLGIVHLLSITSITQLLDAGIILKEHIDLLIVVGAIALLVGVFAGIYPAWYITSFTPALVLKGSFGLSPKGRQLRNSLIGIQFIASFALIVVAMFMYLQTRFMQQSSLGFEKDWVIVTNLNKIVDMSRGSFSNELVSNPLIENVSYSESLFSGLESYSTWARKYNEKELMFQVLAVDTGFFKTMGINLLDGRDLIISDRNKDNPMVFIFNEKARKEYDLSIGDKSEYGDEIVGFVPDVKVTSLRRDVEPMAFTILREGNFTGRNWAYIRVKAGADLIGAMQHVQATLNKISPGYVFDVRFYDEILNDVYLKEKKLTSLITWFSLIAVLISMVGVFGLVVFESEYKRKEIGVRKVLGSTTAQILAMFNSKYIRILIICFVIAAPIAWYAVARWLENFAYRTPISWWVFLLSFLLITVITSLTVTFQSWRVASANPVDSIKTE